MIFVVTNISQTVFNALNIDIFRIQNFKSLFSLQYNKELSDSSALKNAKNIKAN